MCLVPQSELIHSESPFADAINNGTGWTSGRFIINFIITVSLLGTMAGWVLITARSVYAASKEGFFLKSFSKLHPKYATPHIALIVSGGITSIFLFLNFYTEVYGTDEMLSQFVNITTVAAFINLPTYLVTVIAEWILIRKGVVISSKWNNIRVFVALLVSAIAIYLGWIGSIVPVIYWIVAGVVLGIGLACYPLFMQKRRSKKIVSPKNKRPNYRYSLVV